MDPTHTTYTTSRRRTAAPLTGDGEVWTGDQQLATVRYQLHVQQRFIVVTTPEGAEETPGPQEIEGMLTVLTGSWMTLLTAPGAGLQLQLADGRRLPISADGGGPQLRIRATGAFLNAIEAPPQKETNDP